MKCKENSKWVAASVNKPTTDFVYLNQDHEKNDKRSVLKRKRHTSIQLIFHKSNLPNLYQQPADASWLMSSVKHKLMKQEFASEMHLGSSVILSACIILAVVQRNLFRIR